MNRLRNLLIAIILTLSSLSAIAAVVVYYLVATPAGGKILVHYGLLWSAEYASVTVESFEGSIAKGLVLKNVEVKNCPFLGPTTIVRLQRVDVGFPLLNWHQIWINVFNGRLNLSNSDPIVFNGNYTGGVLHGTAYSKSVDVSEIMHPFLAMEVWRHLHGTVSDVDLTLQGTIINPAIKGYFTVDKIEFAETAVRKGFARFDLSFEQQDEEWRMNGPLTLENGVVNIHQRLVELQQSRAEFKGKGMNPDLSIHGTASVDEYIIDLDITGTLSKPVVNIHSDPYLPDDMAYMLLGLGNWEPASSRLPYDNDARRMGLKKRITSDVNLGFALEEPRRQYFGQRRSTYYSKLIEGQLSLTDNISFNFTEEIFPRSNSSDPQDPASQNENRAQGESMLYLQYKRKF